ncbi:MAG: MBL fold metallo-hydrolase [Armatimonadetes bacterium]|nr:MBL fold metallo-hydrolase [Armatimonadota bacterium]
MNIRYLGHSSFLITSNAGTRIVTDPVNSETYDESLCYARFDEAADIVTISHGHRDHSGADMVQGNPIVIEGNGKFIAAEVEFLGVETFHDSAHGADRGRNTVFVMSVDGMRVAHMGDLGHVLSADQAAEIGAVDVALIPVGGYYTIDAAQAAKVAEQVGARITIPMHYRTEKCAFPIAGVDEFLSGKSNVLRSCDSEIEVTRESLPAEPAIVVLEHAL